MTDTETLSKLIDAAMFDMDLCCGGFDAEVLARRLLAVGVSMAQLKPLSRYEIIAAWEVSPDDTELITIALRPNE